MNWREQGLCTQVDPDLWFPEKGHADVSQAAKRICAQCPVQLPCAQAGVGESHGIWGGVSRERRNRSRSKHPEVTKVAS